MYCCTGIHPQRNPYIHCSTGIRKRIGRVPSSKLVHQRTRARPRAIRRSDWHYHTTQRIRVDITTQSSHSSNQPQIVPKPRGPHLAGARRQQEHREPEVCDLRIPLREHHRIGRQKVVRCAFHNSQPRLGTEKGTTNRDNSNRNDTVGAGFSAVEG